MCHDQTERIWNKYLRESLRVPLVLLVPLKPSRSIVSAVATFEDRLGRIPALAWAHTPASAVLATSIADVGNDLKLAGFDESDNRRVFIRPCADLAFLRGNVEDAFMHPRKVVYAAEVGDHFLRRSTLVLVEMAP